MKLTPADIFTLIREAALAFGQDKAPRLAAAIAYYAIFSIAPLLLFAIAVAGRFLSSQDVTDQLLGPQSLLAQNLGEQTATFVRGLIPSESALARGSLFATVVGFVTLFLGATGLFVQLQDALNSLWGADPPPPQGVGNVVKTRLISFAMILGIGLLLFAFLGLNTYLAAIAQSLGDRIGAGAVAVRLGTFGLSTVFLAFVFAGIYKVLPDVKLVWREVWVGGMVTALLFTVGQILIGIYLGRFAPGSAFSAAGALVALLVWVYYSAMIFFFGAEVTWAYSQKYGTRAGGAANVAKKEAVAAQGADIDTAPSAQERDALADTNAGQSVRDARGRVLAVGEAGGGVSEVPTAPDQTQGPAPTRSTSIPAPAPVLPEPTPLPSIGEAVSRAVLAVMAVPAVLAIHVWRRVGRRGRG